MKEIISEEQLKVNGYNKLLLSLNSFNEHTRHFSPHLPLLEVSVFNRLTNILGYDPRIIHSQEELLVSIFISWCGLKKTWNFQYG
jgi:hypothetical protein